MSEPLGVKPGKGIHQTVKQSSSAVQCSNNNN